MGTDIKIPNIRYNVREISRRMYVLSYKNNHCIYLCVASIHVDYNYKLLTYICK